MKRVYLTALTFLVYGVLCGQSPRQEFDMPFFVNKKYVLQNQDYTVMQLFVFSGTNLFLFMTFNGYDGTVASSVDGQYTYKDGQLVVTFPDYSVMRLQISQTGQYSMMVQAGEGNRAVFAEWLSPEDVYSQQAFLYWSHIRSTVGSNNDWSTPNPYRYPHQTPTQEPKVVCAYCRGTGRQCVLRTVPTYGSRTHRTQCTYCGQSLLSGMVHVLQSCPHCAGTGYR